MNKLTKSSHLNVCTENTQFHSFYCACTHWVQGVKSSTGFSNILLCFTGDYLRIVLSLVLGFLRQSQGLLLQSIRLMNNICLQDELVASLIGFLLLILSISLMNLGIKVQQLYIFPLMVIIIKQTLNHLFSKKIEVKNFPNILNSCPQLPKLYLPRSHFRNLMNHLQTVQRSSSRKPGVLCYGEVGHYYERYTTLY